MVIVGNAILVSLWVHRLVQYAGSLLIQNSHVTA